ncbi:hypothetical protein KR038_006395 [Drosophila bunnanda]|nr:hypothetical protein KR038_006395 [Drosophila bunnanda]
MLNISTLLKRRRTMETAVGDTASKRFTFQPPTPLTSAMEASHSAPRTLDGQGEPPEMHFSFRPPNPLPSNASLAIDNLLANNFMSEAFHKARITLDEKGQSLVEHFFRHCIEKKRFKVLAELCLTEDEEQMVYRLLDESGSRQADTVHLILLLQNRKYIEAVNFIEHVTAQRQEPDDMLNRIMSVYRSSMPPVTRSIADTYIRIQRNQSPADGPHTDQIWQNPSDIQNFLFSSLWTENNTQEPMRLHRNLPFLRTQQYGSSELPQRFRTVCPVLLESRHSEQEERDKESSSFLPPIPLGLDKDEGPEEVKETGSDEIIVEIEEAAEAKVLPPPMTPSMATPESSSVSGTDVHTQSRPTLPYSEGAVEEVAVTEREIRPHRSAKRHLDSFLPPIPLGLTGSGGEDAVDKDEGPEEVKETYSDEIMVEIEEAAEAKVLPPPMTPSMATPESSSVSETEVHTQSRPTLPHSEGAVEEVAVTELEIMPRRSAKRHLDSPNVRIMRLRSDNTKEAPPVTTPKGRKRTHNPVLEMIKEEGSLDKSLQPRVLLRSYRGTLSTDSGTSTGIVSIAENSVIKRPRTRSKSIAEAKAECTPMKNSSRDTSPAVATIPSEQPPLQGSELRDTNSKRELRPRRQAASTKPDSLSSERASRSVTTSEESNDDHVTSRKRGRGKKQ